MSDTMGYEDEEQQDNLRELREAAERGKQAKREADEAKRELAFAKAGIDTDSPKGRMFVKAYDGELDGAAIKAQFEELFGTPQDPAAEVVDEVEEARQEALRQQTAERRDLTAAGHDEAPPPAPDMVHQAYQEFEAAMNSGQSRELAFRHVLGGHIAAANAGQPGAVWTGQWDDEQIDSGVVPNRR